MESLAGLATRSPQRAHDETSASVLGLRFGGLRGSLEDDAASAEAGRHREAPEGWMSMSSPSQDELTAAIADATRQAVFALFREHPGRYYYCSLVTTGEAHPPYLSAWSHEALDKAAQNNLIPLLLACC